jgi:transposase-like protein
MSTYMVKTEAKLEIKQKRIFSDDFKRERVKDLVEKRVTVLQICRFYEVSRAAVYKWLYKYSPHYARKTILVVQMESEAFKTQQLLQRVAELERVIGQKQMEIDFLNKLLEIGSEEMGFDLKKNFSTRLSNGTGSVGPSTATD